MSLLKNWLCIRIVRRRCHTYEELYIGLHALCRPENIVKAFAVST
jgi:hypothetical protein